MAKFDTGLIEGFDKMTAEEKLTAILGTELPDDTVELKNTVKQYKDLIDKYTGEISEMKKQQRAGLSDAERKAKEDEEKYTGLLEQYEALQKEVAISKSKAKYIALGYSEELAEDTAKALSEGDLEKVFANAETYKADLEKKVKADLLKGTPHPQGKGTGSSTKTKEEIMAIKDPIERQAQIAEHLELFERK